MKAGTRARVKRLLPFIFIFMLVLSMRVTRFHVAEAASGSTDDQDVGYTYDLFEGSYFLNETAAGAVDGQVDIWGNNWASQEIWLQEDLGVGIITIEYDVAGAPPNNITVSLYDDSGGDPGSFLGSAESNVKPGPFTWVNFTLSPVVVISTAGMYHIVANTSGGDGGNKFRWVFSANGNTYRTNAYQRETSAGGIGGPWNNVDDDHRFRVYCRNPVTYTGYDDTSLANYYDDVFRYDFGYTFPGNCANEGLNVTYPRSQYLLNVSYFSGGNWNNLLGAGNYSDLYLNGSHNIVVVPEATIALYGEDYRLFTQQYSTVFTLYGPYYEDGAAGPTAQVQVYFNNETSFTFILTADYVLVNCSIFAVSWNMSDGTYRFCYPEADVTELIVYYPEATFEDYLFTVYTYQAMFPGWLETGRHVDGVERLIERRPVTSGANQVPMIMVTGATYFVAFLGADGTYDFGVFVPGSNEPTLRMNPITFSSRI